MTKGLGEENTGEVSLSCGEEGRDTSEGTGGYGSIRALTFTEE